MNVLEYAGLSSFFGEGPFSTSAGGYRNNQALLDIIHLRFGNSF